MPNRSGLFLLSVSSRILIVSIFVPRIEIDHFGKAITTLLKASQSVQSAGGEG